MTASKYLLASRITFGARIIVVNIVGIAINAKTESTKLITILNEVVAPKIILNI